MSTEETEKSTEVNYVDVRLVIKVSGENRDTSDVVDYFRMIKKEQPIWNNNTCMEIDLIDARQRK